MKCQMLFSEKNKKFFKVLSADFFFQHAKHYITNNLEPGCISQCSYEQVSKRLQIDNISAGPCEKVSPDIC